ncbi:SPOSA6832_02621, partial [Sporobolomyces salmonicolor]
MTQNNNELRTLLIYQPLPSDLVDDLRTVFPVVKYFPLSPLQPLQPGDVPPTAEDFREAEVIFSFAVPHGLEHAEEAPRLKLFQGLTSGFEHIEQSSFFRSFPDESDATFAGASGIHALFHKLHWITHTLQSEQRWVPHAELGRNFGAETKELGNNFIRDLRTVTVGVMGYGHIGRETARLFHACGSTIYALSRTGLPSRETGYMLPSTGDPTGTLPSRYFSSSSPSSLREFFTACDVIVNTLPGTEATRGFMGESWFKAMKGDAVYVNVGRGTTTDQEALVRALRAERAQGEREDGTGTLRIGGASLDVTDPEPLPPSHPLFTLRNVILTPHCASLSRLYFARAVDLLKVNHRSDLRTLLIYTPLQPPSLVEDLKAVFPVVKYFPIQNFAPIQEGDPVPTEQDFKDADAIFSFVIPPGLSSVDQAPRLKLFQGLSAGYSHVTGTEFFKSLPKDNEMMFASASGIHVLYHKLNTINLMLNNERRWVPNKELGGHYIRELSTLKVGLVGYGHIARETARLFHCAGSTIYALTRNGQPTPESGYVIPNTGDPSGSLPEKYFSTASASSTLEFLAACDVVVNTLPDSDATRKFIGVEQLKAMKGDAVYVNIGRGTTTDQEALIEALKAKPAEGEEEGATGTLRIGGASLDVTDPEPLPDGHELFTMANVVLTPHMSGLSKLYHTRAVDLLKINVERIRAGKGVLNSYRGKGESD